MKRTRVKITNVSEDFVYLSYKQPVDDTTSEDVDKMMLAPGESATAFCSFFEPISIVADPPT